MAATEFKRTETLSKCQTSYKEKKVEKVAVLFKSSENTDNEKLMLRK